MSDLLLTHAYFFDEDEKEQAIMKPYPTLGLLYILAYLRRVGFSVDIFDTTFATRTVVVGGPESANYPEQYLSHVADAVGVGETSGHR